MQNAEYEHTIPPGGRAWNPSPTIQGRIESEIQEIASVQVIFPDRKTADEVTAELWEKVNTLQAEINEMKKKISE